MDPLRMFWRGAGAALLLWGVAGSALTAAGQRAPGGVYLSFNPFLDGLHVALGLALVVAGFARLSTGASRRAALVAGTFLLALAVLGFLSGTLFGIPAALGLPVHLELIENLAHLALGAWGAYVATTDV